MKFGPCGTEKSVCGVKIVNIIYIRFIFRFGEIVGVYATERIQAGREILVNYGFIEK